MSETIKLELNLDKEIIIDYAKLLGYKKEELLSLETNETFKAIIADILDGVLNNAL